MLRKIKNKKNKTKAPMLWLLWEQKWWAFKHLGDASQMAGFRKWRELEWEWRKRQDFSSVQVEIRRKIILEASTTGALSSKIYLNYTSRKEILSVKLDREKSWLILVKGIDFRKNFACIRTVGTSFQEGISWLTEPLRALTVHHKVSVNISVAQHFAN